MNIDAFAYLDKIRSIAFKLPGVTEGIAYGTPAFYTGKKLFARLREEGDILVIYTEERDAWMKNDAAVFYITDHYVNSNYMLVALPHVKNSDLDKLMQAAWLKRSNKSLVKQWMDGNNAGKKSIPAKKKL